MTPPSVEPPTPSFTPVQGVVGRRKSGNHRSRLLCWLGDLDERCGGWQPSLNRKRQPPIAVAIVAASLSTGQVATPAAKLAALPLMAVITALVFSVCVRNSPAPSGAGEPDELICPECLARRARQTSLGRSASLL